MYTVPKLDDYSPARSIAPLPICSPRSKSEVAAVANESDWQEFRDRWMARKNGVLTQVNDTWLKAAPGPQKRDVGQRVNELKAQRRSSD